MNYLANITRPAGDPKVIQSGPSSLGFTDRLGRALGWCGIGLALLELLAPSRVTRALGMQGQEALVTAYGARELGAGVLTLSLDRNVGLWSRVAGDALDLMTLATASRRANPRRDNVRWALAFVAGVTLLDLIAAQGGAARHGRGEAPPRRYADRSGFPRGVAQARGAARALQAG